MPRPARSRQGGGHGEGKFPLFPPSGTEPQQPIRPLWVVPSTTLVGHGKAKHFVDFQNDVSAADVLLASREGYRSRSST